jgi:hypothetical protein
MIASLPAPCVCPAETASRFEALLPELTSRIRACVSTRRARDREDAAAEMIAHCWMNFRQAIQRGIDLTAGQLAWVAWSALKAGRTLTGNSVRDVMSRQCQRRGRAAVTFFSALERKNSVASMSGLSAKFSDSVGYTHRDPAREAEARIDWQSLHDTLEQRPKQLLREFAVGSTRAEAAQVMGVSRGRVTQIGDMLADEVREFFGYNTAGRLAR